MMTRENAKKMMKALAFSIENIANGYLDSLYKIVTKYLVNSVSEKDVVK